MDVWMELDIYVYVCERAESEMGCVREVRKED
jgi:hypothetical protein